MNRTFLTLAAFALAALPARVAAQDSTTVAPPAACSSGAVAFMSENARERAELATAVAGSGQGSEIREIIDITARADKPRLRNGSVVGRLLEQNYPLTLRDAGQSGKVTLLVRIDEKGAVSHLSVQRSARNREFDTAALNVSRGMLFRPARYGGCPIPVWTLIPVTFDTQR